MVTAMLAAANLADGASHDVWGVNSEDVYLEQIVPSDAETRPTFWQPAPGREGFVVDSDGLELRA